MRFSRISFLTNFLDFAIFAKKLKSHFFNFEKIGVLGVNVPLTKMYFWRTKFAKSTIEYCTCYSEGKTGDGI